MGYKGTYGSTDAVQRLNVGGLVVSNWNKIESLPSEKSVLLRNFNIRHLMLEGELQEIYLLDKLDSRLAYSN